MNELMKISDGQAVTMSSREIAELTGKEHKHVLRDIRALLDELEKDGPIMDHPQEDKDSRGYTACFHLTRELTDTLLTGYSATARLRVVRRWHELEARPSIDPMQILSDPAAMRGLLLTYTEKVLALESKVAEDKPKVEALERYIQTQGDLTPIYYLIARYMSDQAAAEGATLQRVEGLMQEVAALMAKSSLKKPARR